MRSWRRLARRLRNHPDVLELRWEVCARSKEWKTCLKIANTLIRLFPERSDGWLNRSVALDRLHRTREAFDTLVPMAAKFPGVGALPYDLARYACLLGDLPGAKTWLKRSFETGCAKEWKALALNSTDLKPLRELYRADGGVRGRRHWGLGLCWKRSRVRSPLSEMKDDRPTPKFWEPLLFFGAGSSPRKISPEVQRGLTLFLTFPDTKLSRVRYFLSHCVF